MALQDPDSQLDVPEVVTRYRDLEARPPPPDIAASLLDPAMYIEERRRLLEVFSHCATHLTPDNHATNCGQSLPDSHPTTDNTSALGLRVVIPPPDPPTYATVPTQTTPIASSSDGDYPPSNPDSDECVHMEECDDSDESDDIEYDDEAGYGVSTKLP